VWSFDLRTNSWSYSSITGVFADNHRGANRKASYDGRNHIDIAFTGRTSDSVAPAERASASISLLRALEQPSESSSSPSSIPSSPMHMLLFGGRLDNNQYRGDGPTPSLSKDALNYLSLRDSSDIGDRNGGTAVTLLDKNDLWLYRVATSSIADAGDGNASVDLAKSTPTNGNIQTLHYSVEGDHGGDEGWVLLSSGGCHAFDDGQTHDPIDIVAVVVLLLILGSVLTGMCCHRFTLRYRGLPLHPSFSRARGYSSVPLEDGDDDIYNGKEAFRRSISIKKLESYQRSRL